MRRFWYFLFLFFLMSGCKHQPREVTASFYYWKTIFQLKPVEKKYLNQFGSKKIYVRIMDIDLDGNSGLPVPVSPISFKEKLPNTLVIVPVVFIVNNALKNLNSQQLEKLSHQIIYFVDGKIRQAGKNRFEELQIDCDWTASTRINYFYLLKKLKEQLSPKQTLSVTLRLHQLKNQQFTGIPPVNRVMLMCYNMGNLRKYGLQNSILELAELKKYLGDNLDLYPLPTDVALPIFSWAVVFRDRQYAGISKRINMELLQDKNNFMEKDDHFYVVKKALPNIGLMQGDEIRWENATVEDLRKTSSYLSQKLKPEPVNLIFFHLEESVLKNYTHDELESISHIFR